MRMKPPFLHCALCVLCYIDVYVCVWVQIWNLKTQLSWHLHLVWHSLFYSGHTSFVMRLQCSFWFTECRKTHTCTQCKNTLTFKSFALCRVDAKQPDPMSRQCLKTTFQNSTPNLICDSIKSTYTVVVSQHTQWIMRKTLLSREWPVWYSVQNTHNSFCCNSSHRSTKHKGWQCISLYDHHPTHNRFLYLFQMKFSVSHMYKCMKVIA